MMIEAFDAVWAIHEMLSLSLEEAAMALGVSRVAQAAWWQGKDTPPGWKPRFPAPLDQLARNQTVGKQAKNGEEAGLIESERISKLLTDVGIP